MPRCRLAAPSLYWWEAEYWNKDVERVLRVEDGPTFTPFPVDEVSVDFRAGRLLGAQPSDFLVVAPRETRFHLAEAGGRRADVTPLRQGGNGSPEARRRAIAWCGRPVACRLTPG